MKRTIGIRSQKSFMRRAVMTVLLAMITMMAWAAKPVTNLDACRGEAYSIYVSGWAFDKDAPDYSLSVKVYVYTDAACKNQYAYKKLATGYVDRPDVVTAHSLPSGSKPGFEGRIPITDPGTYYVKVFAIDIDQWGDDVANSSTEMSHSFNPVTVTTLTTIGSAADWNTFVTVIKSGGEDFAGKTVTLTADIPTAAEIAAGTTAVTTITGENKAFCGTFDGQGHTINVDLNVSGNIAEGLFSNVKGATIKDLTVTGTINNTGMYAGGLVGTAKGATIQNCTFAATINSSGNEIGAFVGGCSQIDADTPGNLTLQDCIFSGSIHITGSYGDSKSAGLVSVWNNTSLTISNCLVKGSFSSERSGAQFYPIAFKTAGVTVTANVSGAYYLNTLPVTTSGSNFISGAEGMAVSNTVTPERDRPFVAVDGNTYYAMSSNHIIEDGISSTADWINFVALVNEGTESFEGQTVKLKSDICISSMVGTSDHPFCGTFDGDGKTMTVDINTIETYAAPFHYIDGATIKNLTVEGHVTSNSTDYVNYAAGFVGVCGSTGVNTITNCIVNTDVSVDASGNNPITFAGGIIYLLKGSLTMERCVYGGTISGFQYESGGFIGELDANTITLILTNCIFRGVFSPGKNGKYNPIVMSGYCKNLNASISDTYYLNTAAPTFVYDTLSELTGTPVSATFVEGKWEIPVTLIDGNIYYLHGKSLPYSYGFENNDLDAEGWSTSSFYIRITAGGHNHTQGLCFKENNELQYLISPELDGKAAMKVSFYYYSTATTEEEIIIPARVGYSMTTKSIDAFTWVDANLPPANLGWFLYENEFPAGTKYVALEVDIPESSYYNRALDVDDFLFEVSGNLPPANLTVSNITGQCATVSWDAPQTNNTITGYVYKYKKDSDENWSEEFTTNSTTVTLTGLIDDTSYEFRVSALYGSNNDFYCTTTKFTTPIVYQSPVNLAISSITYLSATLTWEAPETGTGTTLLGYGYQYRKQGDEDWSEEISVNNTTTTIEGLSDNTRYEFRLRALYDGSHVSRFTNISFIIGDAIRVTAGTKTMDAVHRVMDDVTINDRITINGDVTLILDEGKTLNATSGIKLSAGNKLTIKGKGTLNADASSYPGAGIGSDNVGILVIEDGIINVRGGYRAAGIGGSNFCSNGGSITINGGTINATGGYEGAGIGGGSANGEENYGICGTITINGGKITAIGGEGAPGIGSMDGAPIGGSITLGWTNEDDFIYSSGYANVTSIKFAKDKYFFWSENGVTQAATIDNIGGKKIVPLSEELSHNFDYIAVSGIEPYYLYSGDEINIDFIVKDAGGNELEKGTHFTESYSSFPVKESGNYTLTLTAIDGSGYLGSKEFSFTVGDGIPVTEETTKLTFCQYKVSDDVTIDDHITINGNVKLILDEGKTLTVTKGIEVSGGNKLTIEGKGKLIATGYGNYSGIGSPMSGMFGTLVINDGTIIATGALSAAGIGGSVCNTGGGTIYINGGHVTATGGNGGAGIGGGFGGVCGTIFINGGKVIAIGGNNAPGVGPGGGSSGKGTGSMTLGWTNTDDYIYASSYDLGGGFYIAENQILYDNSGNIYSGKLSEEELSAIQGKELRARTLIVSLPYIQDFSDGMGGWIAVDGVGNTGLNIGADTNFMFGISESYQYLISPQLDLTTDVKLSFYVKNFVAYTMSFDAKFQVGVSTKTNSISDFIWQEEWMASGGSSRLVQYYLPAEVKYVAIKYLPDPGNYLYIDNISFVAVADVSLAEDADNGDIISGVDGYLADVTLQDRTLWTDNEWNTLCLPFSMTASQIAGSPLAGAVIKEVNAETSNMTDGTLTLNFKRTTSISAGKPYIVKWANADLVISSEADWEAFATSVAEGVSYYAKTVMLDTDLTVTEMVKGFFTGTFDGNGHTITLDIDYKESTSNPGQALFYQLRNATVKNLQTEGWVTTSGHRPANIAVYADGTSTISNCTCGASIESTLKNSWVDGGAVVACIKSGATLNITDCYARASVYYENSAYSGGGVVGWTEDATATANLECCVYAPTWIEIEKTDNDPHYFVSGPGQKTLSKCFYNETAEESVLTAEGTNWGVYYNTDDLWSYLGWKRGIKLPKEVVVEFASIEDPVFKDVIIESGNTSVVNFDGGQFIGSYSPFADISGLLLDDHNPDNGACRAALSLSRAFEGWYTDDALTTPVTTIPFTSNGTVKLYAKWSILAGDVNGDGLVTITDAAVLMDYLKTGLEPAGFVKAAADVDGKPGITMSDAVAILEMILNGLP